MYMCTYIDIKKKQIYINTIYDYNDDKIIKI